MRTRTLPLSSWRVAALVGVGAAIILGGCSDDDPGGDIDAAPPVDGPVVVDAMTDAGNPPPDAMAPDAMMPDAMMPDAMLPPDAPPAPTYTHDIDIQPIWTANCTTCHAFLNNAYNNIVGANSPQGGIPRIDPGNPGNSYIWLKINGMQTTGVRMPPPPMPALDAATLTMIETWIMEGAPE